MSVDALIRNIRESFSANAETNQYSDIQIGWWIKESLNILSPLRPRKNVFAEITINPITILPEDIIPEATPTKQIINAVYYGHSVGSQFAINASFNFFSLERLSNVRVRKLPDGYSDYRFWSPVIIEKQVTIENQTVVRYCVEVPSDISVPSRTVPFYYSARHVVKNGDPEMEIPAINTLSSDADLESRLVYLVQAKMSKYLASKFASAKEYKDKSSVYLSMAADFERMAMSGIGDRFL